MILTERKLHSALKDARAILASVGFARCTAHVRVELSTTFTDQRALGFYYPDRSIRLPVLFFLVQSFSQLWNAATGRISHSDIVFVLLHEYGHAVEDALGVRHADYRCFGRGARPTAYAAKNWSEDFAESFAVWASGGHVSPARVRAFEVLRPGRRGR